MMPLRLVFDIDGTICNLVDGMDYGKATVFNDMVVLINDLYEQGHFIIIQTARGMGSCAGSVELAHKMWYEKTKNQLDGWGLRYNELHIGKPYADVYIDDRAFRANCDGSSVEKLREFIGKLLE